MSTISKKLLLASVALTALATSAPVHADDHGFDSGSFLVRVRGIGMVPNVTSSVNSIGGKVDASNSFVPEVDVSYFITRNIAVEAIAASAKHHLTARNTAAGTLDLGHTWILPPTVLAQYHFYPTEQIKPYVGLGVNYTQFYGDDVPAGGVVLDSDFDSGFGFAIQAGVDYQVYGNWYANIDVKHVFLNTTARLTTATGTINADVDLDPTILGFGIGYKF